MLPSLNTISEQQANPAQNTEAAITHFRDYAATNPSTIVQYKDIYMIIRIDSDASYLSKPRARSHTGVHYYLRLLPDDPAKDPNFPPPSNGKIHTEFRILKYVVASVAKSEVGGLICNGQTAVPIYTNLNEIIYPQSATPIKIDNSDSGGINTTTIRQKMYNAMNM